MHLGTAASDSRTLLRESFLIRRFPGKIVRHQPETYRSLTTSFIASLSQGIHPMLLIVLLGTVYTTCPFVLFIAVRALRAPLLLLTQVYL